MKNLCWIRRDLRLHDHASLSAALASGETTVVFVFDRHILDKLKNKQDRRVSFIYQSLQEMEKKLQQNHSSLIIRYGFPEEEIPKLCQELEIQKVFLNRDYEPYAKKRDDLVAKKLKTLGVELETFKDSVFFEKHEVLKNDGSIYKVFTPYKNRWLEKFEQSGKVIPDLNGDVKNLRHFKNPLNILEHNWYQQMGFRPTTSELEGGSSAALLRLENFKQHLNQYKEARDFPALPGTSNLSVYIRFGNLSVRDMLRTGTALGSEGARTWVSEIIWRDFYQMILDTHPYVEKSAFKREYDQIRWPGTQEDFLSWCEGRTGFPIVDAAMRCLNQTGMMHNRLRMIVASFLCKTLLVDWRQGEHYFAEHLLDFDLAANNGGWQWSSSSGCDAQPYFRIFNPYSQSEKFDPKGDFIKRWIPELASASGEDMHKPNPLLFPNYPRPVVSYEKNRQRCLELYSVVKKRPEGQGLD
jgi:deoxyribodipyrimidine photo-lyase